MKFKQAVAKTLHLKNAYREGLQALRAEDKPHIDAENTRSLSGSVDIDTALQQVDPHGNRWDFGIAYKHANRNDEVIYWTELHTASSAEVKVVIKKAQWLHNWLKNDGNHLAKFDSRVIWVSSGATRISPTSPQSKQMAQLRLEQVGNTLHIRNKW